MITVHHLEQSRSTRILWLLEELDIPYELKVYQRDPETMAAPESLKQVHPLGKSPVITDESLTIAESGAIIEYILDTYGQGRLRPTSGKALLDYRFWLHFAEGSLMPLLVMTLVLNKTKSARMPFFVKPIARKLVDSLLSLFIKPRLFPQLDLIEAHLSEHTWFAGDKLSGADMQMLIPLQLVSSQHDLSAYSHINEYLAMVEQLPAYQRAVAKAK